MIDSTVDPFTKKYYKRAYIPLLNNNWIFYYSCCRIYIYFSWYFGRNLKNLFTHFSELWRTFWFPVVLCTVTTLWMLWCRLSFVCCLVSHWSHFVLFYKLHSLQFIHKGSEYCKFNDILFCTIDPNAALTNVIQDMHWFFSWEIPSLEAYSTCLCHSDFSCPTIFRVQFDLLNTGVTRALVFCCLTNSPKWSKVLLMFRLCFYCGKQCLLLKRPIWTLDLLKHPKMSIVRKIFTNIIRQHRATFIWSCVPGHLMKVSLIFTLLFVLFWSSSAPEGNIWLFRCHIHHYVFQFVASVCYYCPLYSAV